MPFLRARRIVRVNTNAGHDPFVHFGDRNTATHIVRTAAVPNRQNAPHTRIPCPLQDALTIPIEAGIIQVRMRVDEHDLWVTSTVRHWQRLRGSRSIWDSLPAPPMPQRSSRSIPDRAIFAAAGWQQ